jgi:hypothetical protein
MLNPNARIRRFFVPALMAALLSGVLAPPAAIAQHRSNGFGREGGHGHDGGRGWGYGGGMGPALATLLTIGAVTYWVEADPYDRAGPWGSYVVLPPANGRSPALTSSERLYVYPSQAQTPEKQANDEYDCHRWAVAQTGVNPVAPTEGVSIGIGQRHDYLRAQSVCLEGRGYSVR